MDVPLCKFCHTYVERFYSQRYYIMNEIKVIGIDLAKSVFQVCVWMSDGNIAFNRKVSRAKLLDTIRQFPPGSMIAMEACATSHYWGRTFQSIGFQVRLIPTQHVKALTHHQKNDANDALAICETAFRPGIHFVAIKTVEQQAPIEHYNYYIFTPAITFLDTKKLIKKIIFVTQHHPETQLFQPSTPFLLIPKAHKYFSEEVS